MHSAVLTACCVVLCLPGTTLAVTTHWPVHALRPDPAEQLDPAGDYFGGTLDLDNGRVAVGRFPTQLPGLEGDDTGATYVFDVASGGLLGRLKTEIPPFAWESLNVGLSGNQVAVVTSDASGTSTFVLDAVTGETIASLDPPLGVSGKSIAVDGDAVLSGGRVRRDFFDERWEAYLFDSNTGALRHNLTPANLPSSQLFGSSLSLSDQYALIGSPNSVFSFFAGPASAYLFDRDSGAELFEWQASTTGINGSQTDDFGKTVALGDGIAAIGRSASAAELPNSVFSGDSLEVFDTTTGELLRIISHAEVGVPIDARGMAVDGTTAVLGVRDLEEPSNLNVSHSAVAIDLISGEMLGKFAWPKPAIPDNTWVFPSIDIEGDQVVIGVSPRERFGGRPTGPGVVYTYDLNAVTGDYDGDGTVTPADYTLWTEQFGSEGDWAADGNGDGRVDVADYTLWRDAYEASQMGQTVPEPGGLALVLLAGLGLAGGVRQRFRLTQAP